MPIIRLPVPGEVPVAMLSTTEFPEPAGDSAVIGVSTYAARADHVHPKQEIDISDKLSITNPQPPGTANPGINLLAAREDHVHPNNLSDIVPQGPGTANAGTSNESSRSDHVHPRQIIDVDINTAPIKTTTVFDDFIPLIDSQSNNSLKRVKIINSIRQKLYTNLNLYVRKDGNDSNDGLTNTSGGAFLTIQTAINRSSWYDYNGFNIVINVGDGTYVESLTIYNGMQVGLGTLFIQGNTTTPANVSIRNNTAAATINIAKGGTKLYLRSLKLANDGTGHCLFVQNSSICDLQSVDFGIGGASGNTIHILSRGHTNIFGNYNVTAGAVRHLHADMGGVIEITTGVVSVTGNFSGQFAFADMNGTIYASGMTFTGSVTGQKYFAQGGGCIQTYTGNVNYFPGNSAGSLGVGGYYG